MFRARREILRFAAPSKQELPSGAEYPEALVRNKKTRRAAASEPCFLGSTQLLTLRRARPPQGGGKHGHVVDYHHVIPIQATCPEMLGRWPCSSSIPEFISTPTCRIGPPLLRARSEWPRCRACKSRDEVAPLHGTPKPWAHSLPQACPTHQSRYATGRSKKSSRSARRRSAVT